MKVRRRARNVPGLERGHLVLAEIDVQCRHGVREMVRLGRAGQHRVDHRVLQHPSERDLRHGDATLGGDPLDRINDRTCLEDGRATNAQLTDAGQAAYEASRSLYATAVRRMVLDGLDADGVTQLADLSYSILTKLDPDARLKVTEAGRACAADPIVR